MLKFIILISFILYSSSALSNDCEINQLCELEGTLVIYKTPPEFTAYIELTDSCVPLALSLEQYDHYSYLNHKPVAITGSTFLHRSGGHGVISYKQEGRWVGNFCSASYGLYISNRGIKAR